MTVQCCKCKRVREAGQWTGEIPANPQHVSHTYCPTCLDSATREIRAERERTRGPLSLALASAPRLSSP